MSGNEREGLRERIAGVLAEALSVFIQHGSCDLQNPVDAEAFDGFTDRVLALLSAGEPVQAQEPVEPIMHAALMEAKAEAVTLRQKLDEWIAYADSLASPVASAPEACCIACGEGITTDRVPVCGDCIPTVDIGHRASAPEEEREARVLEIRADTCDRLVEALCTISAPDSYAEEYGQYAGAHYMDGVSVCIREIQRLSPRATQREGGEG